MITCKDCGAQLPDTAKFCTGCGATLVDFDAAKPVIEAEQVSVGQPTADTMEAPVASPAPTAVEQPAAYTMPQTHPNFEPEHHSALTSVTSADLTPGAATSTIQPEPIPMQVPSQMNQPQMAIQPQETAPITGAAAAVAAGAAPVGGKQTAFEAATSKGKSHIPTAFEQATGSNGGDRVDRANPPIFPANQPRFGNGSNNQ